MTNPFKRKKPPIAEAHAPAGKPMDFTRQDRDDMGREVAAKCALTSLERLKLIRSGKESELQKLAQDLAELDQVISWMQRFPEVEKILAYLRNRL